jgi:hypothetical protein
MNLKPPDTSDALRLCFYSAGAARTEVYVIEMLIIKGYRISKVYLCDIEYGKESFASHEKIIVEIMGRLRISYKLLKSNDALIAETLKEIDDSGEDANIFKYDAIIAIHGNDVESLASGIKGLTLMNDVILGIVFILTAKVKLLMDTSKIAQKIAPTPIDAFFPPLISVASGGKGCPIVVFRRRSITTQENYRKYYKMIDRFQHSHDGYYNNTIVPLYNKFLEMDNEFKDANPLFGMNGSFGRPSAAPFLKLQNN